MKPSSMQLAFIRRISKIATLLVLVGPLLQACSCANLGAPCEAAWRMDAVFLGKAVRVAGFWDSIETGGFELRRVTFRIDERFRGVSSSTVDVMTPTGGGACGFPFEEGRDYLVYASRIEGVLYAGICSRTALREKAALDLAYLRSLATSGAAGRVFGVVRWYAPGSDFASVLSSGEPRPAANVQVHLESQAGEKRVLTDGKGQYAFEGLPGGKFFLWTGVPGSAAKKRAVILHDHACLEQDLRETEVVKRRPNDARPTGTPSRHSGNAITP